MSQSTEFRADLVKIMPGYKWTISNYMPGGITLIATGMQSSGSNRLSTLKVERTDRDGLVTYKAKSSGYGKKAHWLYESQDGTLARALRGLQQHYEAQAASYRSHAAALQRGREPQKGGA